LHLSCPHRNRSPRRHLHGDRLRLLPGVAPAPALPGLGGASSLAVVSPGLDLESSFSSLLEGLGLTPAAAHLVWLPLPMVLVLVSAVVGVLVTVWLERKISAAVQQRIGPEYAGALGVLQPLADGLKLLFKEDIIPARADGLLFTLGPILVVVPVILSWLVVPFGQNLLISNVGVGIFLWIALSSLQPIGLLMSGYASNNKYSLLVACGPRPSRSATRSPWPCPCWRW